MMAGAAEHHQPLYTLSGGTMARRVSVPAGTVIFEKGQKRDCAYIIDSGLVHIRGADDSPADQVVCLLGPGEIFGEMALIDSGPRTATAEAAEDTDVFFIPRKAVQKRLSGLDPLISLFMSLLIQRYRVTRIHMPESIKQEGAADLLDRLERTKGPGSDISPILDVRRFRDVALEDLRVEQELRAGLMDQQFVAYLQPIVRLPDRRVMGFESLIRWQHPQRGLVGPLNFIPVAERTNVVQLLDAMMLEQACAVVGALSDSAGHDIFIGVNLSGVNFESLTLVETVRQMMQQYKTKPQHIRLEMTESALIDDPVRAQEILSGLKDLGLTIALDDFGTGYSSLSYLHKFAIDTLKIDRAFVSSIGKDPKSLDIVRAITGLAKTFKLSTVAEGIERNEEAEALSSIGCDMGQGYLFGKPMPLDAAHEFVRKGGAASPAP